MEEKEEFIQRRLEDVLKKIYWIHELRWLLGIMYCDTVEEAYLNYYEANEMLSEFEKHLWITYEVKKTSFKELGSALVLPFLLSKNKEEENNEGSRTVTNSLY